MKILVTGGAGFIGSHFVRLAASQGHEVFVLDALTYAGSRANLDPGVLGGFLRGRVERYAHVAACLDCYRPDAVVHLAAETHVTRSLSSPKAFMASNAVGTYVLLDQCVKYRDRHAPHLRVVNVSTDEVYGSLGPEDDPWTESSPHAPNNPYSASKAAADHLARAYFHTYGLNVITTHSSNNYGPKQHPEKLIPTLARRVLDGKPLQLHGDGLHVRDWIHVEDHCDGLLKALNFGKAGSVVNFSGGCERTNLQVAYAVSDRFPGVAGIEFIQDRAGNDRRYAMSNEAAARIGWSPGGALLEDRLAETVRWYLNNPNYHLCYGK